MVRKEKNKRERVVGTYVHNRKHVRKTTVLNCKGALTAGVPWNYRVLPYWSEERGNTRERVVGT